MKTNNRLLGIDLCRGLAAFAVILVHSGDETWGLPISNAAIEFRHSFYFAVPFFLAASFYFSTQKLPLKLSTAFWEKKFKRILIPYIIWSIFYLAINAIFLAVKSDFSGIAELISDPTAIILFGGTSYHLYFLPLLFIGLSLLYVANLSAKLQNSIPLLTGCCLVSLMSYQQLRNYNNSFNLGNYTAFSELLSLASPDSPMYVVWRIFLVYTSWVIRCMPYFFIALLINKLIVKLNKNAFLNKKIAVGVFFTIFICTTTLGKNFLYASVSEVIIAYSLLLFGISISSYLSSNKLIASLGSCSFGIYLLHPVIKSAVEIVLVNSLSQMIDKVSISSMIIYALPSFLLSWFVIALLLMNKKLSQYI